MLSRITASTNNIQEINEDIKKNTIRFKVYYYTKEFQYV